jgi:hypothetical protein
MTHFGYFSPSPSCTRTLYISFLQAQQVPSSSFLLLVVLTIPGYIGGSVLTRLLSHSLSDTFQITALVRDELKAKKFRTLGVKTAVGSYSDHSLLRRLASEADIVFACVSRAVPFAPSIRLTPPRQADADDLDAAEAILAGLRDRFERTGTPPSLIHTVCPSMSSSLSNFS